MLGAYTERAVVGAQTASHACSEIFLLHLLSDPSKTDWSVGTAGADRIPPGVETEDPSDPGRMVGIELVPAGSSRPVFFLAMPKCANCLHASSCTSSLFLLSGWTRKI